MDKKEFINTLTSLKSATSLTGKRYNKIEVRADTVLFIREGKTEIEYISINELLEFFSSEKFVNTTNAKSYISGRVQSPAVAILNALTTNSSRKKNSEPTILETEDVVAKKKKSKDETKFFLALSDLMGEEYLLSKSIGKPVNSGHIFLSNNYKAYSFSSKIESAYSNLLEALKSDFIFSGNSLSHFIDGVIINHSSLGNRIVEFDEEQHFTPARMETLKMIGEVTNNNYVDTFLSICKDSNYNKEVLSKHHIKNRLVSVPKNFEDFYVWLQSSNEKESGYIKRKNGFPFLGGRIAQRAYYDSLRDTAHLSTLNKDYSSPIRFAKKTFEDKAKTHFRLITRERLKALIKDELKKTYQLEIK
ncbi:hypothetical protein V5739_00440 [Salinimicrobium sp. TIG7-5_MAKvit]|uniref:hypothetical protein n=1 Tax=Salinimicrobium sp. TIG7-5_MAKvit TaxID=3121289 RepID=UPI003C6E2978